MNPFQELLLQFDVNQWWIAFHHYSLSNISQYSLTWCSLHLNIIFNLLYTKPTTNINLFITILWILCICAPWLATFCATNYKISVHLCTLIIKHLHIRWINDVTLQKATHPHTHTHSLHSCCHVNCHPFYHYNFISHPNMCTYNADVYCIVCSF